MLTASQAKVVVFVLLLFITIEFIIQNSVLKGALNEINVTFRESF